ncbi:MFS transporter [Actinoplanes sp. NBC_00393]|uniref:MFS transporter n=1 Tax=Actinoplanes sp. NBC_00393 TaxID=2975953 RepID=UPI002E20C687
MNSYRWVVLAVATFTQAASGFFVQGIGALGVQLQFDLGLSAAQLGLLMSAAQLAPLLGLLVAGALLDRFDERWVVGAGAAVVGAALLAGAWAPGYAALLAVLFVVGAGYSTVQPGGSKSVASWFDASRRGTAMGIRQAGLPFGAALASAVLPPLAVAHGWRAACAFGGVIALLGAAAFLLFHRRPPAPLTAAPQNRGVVRSPALIRATLCGISLVSVHCGIGLLTVLHLHEVAGMTAGAAASVLVGVQIAGMTGRIVLAACSDRTRSRQSVVTVSMLAIVAGLALLVTPAGRIPVTASLVFVWLGFFGIGWIGPWIAQVTEAAPPGRTGFVLGLVMAVNQAAIVIVPPVLGALRDVTGGFAAPWALLIAMTAAALAGLLPGRGVPPSGSDRRRGAAAGAGRTHSPARTPTG